MRYKCEECSTVFHEKDALKAKNPFDESICPIAIWGCPSCFEVNTKFVMVCEVDDCDLDASCGTPTEDRYWRTCYKHIPK
jgi:hypothetical protein